MPKSSAERTNARKEEIISAAESLYQKKGFKDITIQDIARETSFTRTSIYNYFETKEEIFMALLQKEYERWVEELDTVIKTHTEMGRDDVADVLAVSLENRKLLLKLMSMNHFDMEENSRLERLVEFKVSYGASIKAVGRLLQKFCTDMSDGDRQDFIYSFFPFVYGIFPYTRVTEKQKTAMEKADVGFTYMSIYQMAYTCARKLLSKN
ncbi:MAG: TetR/AcrR family transcriptional regulator [Eubacterium sp.]|jgi:AcrR family transcriptional regulator|nr:TetR/AcrR family transcriptional regulator [Eubacterium sp.]